MNDELANRRAARSADIPSVDYKHEAVLEALGVGEKVSQELKRLGDGVTALSKEWAETHPEQSKELWDLLCRRGRWKP